MNAQLGAKLVKKFEAPARGAGISRSELERFMHELVAKGIVGRD